eukprot:5512729-Pyramimonas_sp.AAC.1
MLLVMWAFLTLLDASWTVVETLGATWAVMDHLIAILGRLDGPLARPTPSGAVLGILSRPTLGLLEVLQGRLGGHLGVLDAYWPFLGQSREPLGLFWGHRGGLMCDLGAISGDSWAVSGRRKAREE